MKGLRHGTYGNKIVTQKACLLDLFPGASSAYSLRLLTQSYNGPCIKVRRESDSAEQDIGFDGNNISQNELAQFCKLSNGRVVTWYDQSGNGRNATTSASTSTLTYVWDGSTPQGLYYDNEIINSGWNLNRMFFDHTLNTSELNAYKFAAPSTTWSFSMVGCVLNNSGNNNNVVATDGGGFNSSGIYIQNNTIVFNTAGAVSSIGIDSVINRKNYVMACQYNSNNTARWMINESESALTSITNYSTGARSNFILGSYYGGATRNNSISLNGFISELITYNNAINIKDVHSKQFYDFKINQ